MVRVRTSSPPLHPPLLFLLLFNINTSSCKWASWLHSRRKRCHLMSRRGMKRRGLGRRDDHNTGVSGVEAPSPPIPPSFFFVVNMPTQQSQEKQHGFIFLSISKLYCRYYLIDRSIGTKARGLSWFEEPRLSPATLKTLTFTTHCLV